MMKFGTVILVLGIVVAGAVLLAGGLTGGSAASVDEAAVIRLLEDRSQPWFRGHQMPLPQVVQMTYTSSETMGAFPEPPVRFPVMSLDLAWHLTAGSKRVPKGHPFEGRPALLFDMRLKSRHLLEHIPGSTQRVWKELPAALKTGELKDMPRNSIVILYGEAFPHYDAPQSFRAEGFDAVYCLEGGLRRWKERGFPAVSDATAVAFFQQEESERPPAVEHNHGILDPENIGPVALKIAMDNGLKPQVVFVGDQLTYDAGRLPGALRVTYEEIPKRFEKEDRDRLILIYCGCCEGSAKGLSGLALAVMKRMGFRRLLHLEGHLKGWKDHGYPLESGNAPAPRGE